MAPTTESGHEVYAGDEDYPGLAECKASGKHCERRMFRHRNMCRECGNVCDS